MTNEIDGADGGDEGVQPSRAPAKPTFPASFTDSGQKLPFTVRMSFNLGGVGEWYATLKNPPVPNQWEYRGRHNGWWYEFTVTSADTVTAYISSVYETGGYSSETASARCYIVKKPVITTQGILIGLTPIIEGNGAVPEANITLYSLAGIAHGSGIADGNGTWRVQSTGLSAGSVTITCKQMFKGVISDQADPVTLDLKPIITPPTIFMPAQDQVLPTKDPIIFGGTCYPGSTIVVVRADNHYVELSDHVLFGGASWQLPLKQGVSLASGALTIQAQYNYPGAPHGYSPPITFNVLGRPVIKTPDRGTLLDVPFSIGGDNGLDAITGAVIELYQEPDVWIQTRGATPNGGWTMNGISLPAGPASLVAESTFGNLRSGRSAPVAYKIRPPIPVVKVNFDPPPGTVRFHGDTGYDGATVQVIIVNGPVGTPPPMVVVDKNNWSTTASGWPYGDYEVNVIQKVPGGASDWIESQPSKHKLTVSVSPPTATYEVNERVPRFSGTGINNAIVSITDHEGNPVGAGTTTVSGGTWSVTATSAWAPVKDRIIWVVQRVDVHTSQPFVLNVTIDPLETPTDVAYRTEAYQPVFSGKGVVGATVYIQDESGVDVAQPLLLTTTAWTIPAKEIWGPTSPARKIHVLQKKDGFSSERVALDVSIALLAPEITEIIDVTGKDLYVRVIGKGWTGATVTLTFSDSGAGHSIDVRDGNWAFERTTPFVPATVYTATAIQKFGGQASPAASKTFEARLPAPTITHPGVGDDEWRDLTVIGGKGYKGASMQIWDAQFVLPLGNPKVLDADGVWSINLIGLDLRTTEIKAIQSFNSRDSADSNIVKFDVTVLPPQITVPIEGGHLPRISTLSGKGVKGAMVTVWLQGESEPLLNQVLVNDQGIWSGTVILPVGAKVIRCQQCFANIPSKDSPLRTYDVVPASPVIETPVAGEHVGRRVVVSGFGVPGDNVTVALGSAANPIRQSSPVLEDRTWSVTLEIEHPGGEDTLRALASCDGFTSDAAERVVRLGTYQPCVDVPAPGQWVSHPVVFSGQGRPGVGQVASWFNPEQVWVPNVAVTAAGWQGEALQALPPGGQWCRFRQTLTDGADGATLSDWVDSGRFESEPPAT